MGNKQFFSEEKPRTPPLERSNNIDNRITGLTAFIPALFLPLDMQTAAIMVGTGLIINQGTLLYRRIRNSHNLMEPRELHRFKLAPFALGAGISLLTTFGGAALMEKPIAPEPTEQKQSIPVKPTQP